MLTYLLDDKCILNLIEFRARIGKRRWNFTPSPTKMIDLYFLFVYSHYSWFVIGDNNWCREYWKTLHHMIKYKYLQSKSTGPAFHLLNNWSIGSRRAIEDLQCPSLANPFHSLSCELPVKKIKADALFNSFTTKRCF